MAGLAACARDDAAQGEPFRLLTPDEGRTLDAVVARLIPSEDGIGAREAGAVHFIDRALEGPFADGAPFLRGELEALVNDGFAELSQAEQVARLEAIEDTEFFGFLMALTVFGTFSDPQYGGGRGNPVERIYGIELRPGWQPPFGWYDAEVAE
jgi:gluconate 2-dehydrogenase gamma chain